MFGNHGKYQKAMVVVAYRKSQYDCWEDAYASGAVYELATVKSHDEFCAVRAVAEKTANMMDGGEELDIRIEAVGC